MPRVYGMYPTGGISVSQAVFDNMNICFLQVVDYWSLQVAWYGTHWNSTSLEQSCLAPFTEWWANICVEGFWQCFYILYFAWLSVVLSGLICKKNLQFSKVPGTLSVNFYEMPDFS